MLIKAGIVKSLLACGKCSIVSGVSPNKGIKKNIVHYITSVIRLALYPVTSATT